MSNPTKRGRPKGSRNKVTNEAKRALLMAFDEIGGFRRLAQWIRADTAHETLFWTRIFPLLLPRPAPEPAPAPEAAPTVRGALTWKTPDWAKPSKAKTAGGQSRQAVLRAGVAATACALAETAGDGSTGPPDGPPPPGWVADVGR